jgi:hypothetical protein
LVATNFIVGRCNDSADRFRAAGNRFSALCCMHAHISGRQSRIVTKRLQVAAQ